jgi:hypothetical protein
MWNIEVLELGQMRMLGIYWSIRSGVTLHPYEYMRILGIHESTRVVVIFLQGYTVMGIYAKIWNT